MSLTSSRVKLTGTSPTYGRLPPLGSSPLGQTKSGLTSRICHAYPNWTSGTPTGERARFVSLIVCGGRIVVHPDIAHELSAFILNCADRERRTLADGVRM